MEQDCYECLAKSFFLLILKRDCILFPSHFEPRWTEKDVGCNGAMYLVSLVHIPRQHDLGKQVTRRRKMGRLCHSLVPRMEIGRILRRGKEWQATSPTPYTALKVASRRVDA